jgi:hypothetical protein
MSNEEDIKNAEDILEELDDLISKHVIDARSAVEAGWKMRGFIAYLTKTINRDEKTDPNYGSDYRDGIRAARVYMESK